MTGQRPRVTASLTPRAEVEVFAGQFGPAGPSTTLTVADTITGPPGTDADVTISGQSPNQELTFTIPRGDTGATGETGPAGQPTAFELRGTGMPEGTVTAPVGSYYTDTAATNGAIRWVKATGAAATGWRVLWGDTGWRNLPLLNGWAGTAVQIRRQHDYVTLRMQALSAAAATSDTFADLAPYGLVGWRAPNNAQRNPIAMFGLSIPDLDAARMALWDYAATGTFGIRRTIVPAAASITDMFTWFTVDAWPATLP